MNKLPTLIAIPHHTQYLDGTGSMTFRQDNVYIFTPTNGGYDEYSTKDERNDNHYADREWLEENFELYEERPAQAAEIVEVSE